MDSRVFLITVLYLLDVPADILCLWLALFIICSVFPRTEGVNFNEVNEFINSFLSWIVPLVLYIKSHRPTKGHLDFSCVTWKKFRSFALLTLGSDPPSVTFHEGCVLGLDYLFSWGCPVVSDRIQDFSFQFVFYLQIPIYFLFVFESLITKKYYFQS